MTPLTALDYEELAAYLHSLHGADTESVTLDLKASGPDQRVARYDYSADGTLRGHERRGADDALVERVHYVEGARVDVARDEVYLPNEVGAMLVAASGTVRDVYYQADHVGNIVMAYHDANRDGVVDTDRELVEESRYFPYGMKLGAYRASQTEDVPFAFNGAEELAGFEGFHLTTYRTMAPETGVWGQGDPKAQYNYGYSPYSSMNGNPISYNDPDGDFITWSIHGGGFSIGVNFTPFGIGGGGGLNFGWGNGFSIGVYGEAGYRVGGTSFGAGATATQSVDYNFRHKAATTTTSAGVYGSLGPLNAGGNVASTYDLTNGSHAGYSWGVSAGVGVGNERGGVGLFVGYGSGGWNYGLGGYYDPRVELTKTNRALTANDDGTYSSHLDEQDFVDGDSFNKGEYATNLQGNPNISEAANGDGSFTYTLSFPKRYKVTGVTGSDALIMSSSGSRRQFTFTTLGRARNITFQSRRPYSGNYFNFKNFNVSTDRNRNQLMHNNLFGRTWFR